MASKGEAKLPEATETLESLGSELEELKRVAKAVFPCLSDLCQAFDAYGKARTRSSKGLLSVLHRADPESSEHLTAPIISLASSFERTGNLISEQFLALSTDITQADFWDEANSLRRSLSDDIQSAAKEVLSARNSHDKAQSKYEKQVKETDSAHQAHEKARADPTNTYQISTTEKYEDKSKAAKNALIQVITALNDARQRVNDRLADLETIVQTSQTRHFAFTQKALQQAYQCFTRFLSAVKMVVAGTETSPESETQRIEKLSEITLDVMQKRDSEVGRSGGGFNAEYFSRKLEGRIHSFDERYRVVKALKVFVGDLATQEETLVRGMQLVVGQTQMQSGNSECVKAWKLVGNVMELMLNQHSARSQVIATDLLPGLKNITAEQGTMAKSLQETAQKLIREHTSVEDKSIRAQQKAEAEEQVRSISEKKLASASEMENTVLQVIQEHVGKEEIQMGVVKTVVQRLGDMEQELKRTYGAGIKTAEGHISEIDIEHGISPRPDFHMSQEPRLSPLPLPSDLPAEETKKEEAQTEGPLAPFALPQGTTVLSTHSCALQSTILLQGTMYITASHICFRSKFNASTLVGRETKVVIPIKDIVRLEKRSILLFPTGIAVVMKDAEIVFGSVMKRDSVIAEIEALMTGGETVEEVKVMEETQETLVAATPEESTAGDVGRDTFKDRMFPDEQLPLHPLKSEVTFPGSAVAVYQSLFSHESDFWSRYLTACKNTNLVLNPWTPVPPSPYSPSPCPTQFGSPSTRKLTYTHPVREKVPFMPTTCSTEENWSLYCLNNKEFIVESAVTVSGVPMADTFVVKMRWNVRESDRETKVTVDYGVVFVKDTWFKGKIEKSSVSEVTEALNTIWLPLATETWKSRKPEIISPPAAPVSAEGMDIASLKEKLIPSEQLKLKLLKSNVSFEGTAREVFECLFRKGDFWELYLKPRGDVKIVITDWVPEPPGYYAGTATGTWPASSTRKLTYTHPVREKMPFVPSTCSCTEDWSIFYLSRTQFIIDCVVVVTGVPMADSFNVKMRWSVTEEGQNSNVEVLYGVNFLKDTWFKSKIEGNSVSEATEAVNKYWVPIANKAWMEFISTKSAPIPGQTEAKPPETPVKSAPIPEETKTVEVEVPVKTAVSTQRDPLIWVLLALVLVLLLQVYRLSIRVSALEIQRT